MIVDFPNEGWECLAQAEHSTFLPVCMAVWGFPEAYTRDQEGTFNYDPNRAADAFLRLDTLAELKRFVIDTYGVRQDVRPCYGAGVRAFWRAQEARLVAEWPRMLEEWMIRGKSGRNVATAQVNFNQVWTLADAKRLHDELAWYWTEFNCDLRDGGGAMDIPDRPFASSEVRKLVAESKDVFNEVEDEASLMTAKATMADIVRSLALYRQGVLGSEDNPWGSGESVFVWTNGTGALVFEGRGRTDDFASAAERPWAESMPGVRTTRVAETVTLGTNTLKGIAATAPVNGLVLSDLFSAIGGQDPAGAISGAEFEQVQIIDGKAYLSARIQR